MVIKIISAPNQKAFGGDLLSHGATWDNGFTYIGSGGSHESNPNDGVQLGMDPLGIPNLVEEGEVVWNDFVFSRRINVPKKDREIFKLRGNKPLSYADAARKLAKEAEERPNDPFSKASLDKMLTSLSDSQEALKEKREQRRAREQFMQMGPEEQLLLMQMAQQQQMVPLVPQDPTMGMMDNPYGNMTAQGGMINTFKRGGNKEPKSKLGRYNMDWFQQRAKNLRLGDNFLDDFTLDTQNRAANLAEFNKRYADYQRQQALDTYTAGQRQNWINQELASGRYKRGDNGQSIYKAQLYGDTDLGKDYISAAGDRITADEYMRQRADYDALTAQASRTAEEQARVNAFNNAAYKKSPIVKGQFAKDYNGNTIYDYSNDLSDTWTSGRDFSEGFKWNDKDAAQISYDTDFRHSPASYLRYAPAIGGAIGLMNDIFSRPDYSRAQEIKNAGSYTPPTVDYKPIGNYLQYNPMDINFGMNKLGQEAAATRRSIQNTAGTRGAAMAGILASDYNAQQSFGDLYRSALEYNDAQKQKVEDFNRGTNLYNSQQDLAAQRYNQAAIQLAMRDRFQGIVSGNTLMDNIDARRSASMNANLTNLVNSIGQIGEEAYDQDRIKALENRGILQNPYKACGGMLTKPKRRGGKR